MQSSGHHIRRHVLDLHFQGDDADGPRLRAAATRWQREVWMPMLERVLDDMAPGDETIAIDRLEVDLEGLTPSEWNEGAELIAMERLREAVRKRLQGVVEHAGSAARRALDSVAHYLRTGALPWWSPKEVTTVGPGAWLRSWVEESPSATLADEVPTMMHSVAARTRLAAELPEPLFWRLVRAIIRDRDPSFWKHEYIRCKAILEDAGVPGETFCVTCRAAVLAAALRVPDEAHLARDFVEELSAVLEPGTRQALAGHLAQLREKEDVQNVEEATTEEQDPDSVSTTPLEKVLPSDALLLQDFSLLDAIRSDESLHTHYIGSAGAVLLAPFLPAFFKGLDLVRENSLTDAARATVLVHHLVSGADAYGEWDLLLPKILCGLSPDVLVPTGAVVLSKDEKEEADALLRAVIEHWSVLKNTSPEGLRSSFLQRDGRLTEKEEGWRLLVQPAAHDVLLHHLPWSISIIKLPWMRAPVFVDWE